MIALTDYLDRLSIIKVLSFFLLIILVLTLIPMVYGFDMGSLVFKLILYGIMLLFFIYNFKRIDKKEDLSLSISFKNEINSLLRVSDLKHVLFIVIANILFVCAVYFVLEYLAGLSILQFDSPLFGDFSSVGIGVVLLYLVTVVLLSPIIEETLFRGIFLRRFNKELGNVTLAILITSIIFGICHSFGGILGAILFGICVSILYIKSRNILLPIIAHFLNNLISFVLALSGIEYFIQGNVFVIDLIIVLAIISNAVLFAAIFKEWPKGMF